MAAHNYVYGKRSLANLAGAHPFLVRIAWGALDLANAEQDGLDLAVVDADRTKGEAKANAAKGTGVVDSKHVPKALHDWKALALDCEPASSYGDPYPRDKDSLAVRKAKLDRFRVVRGQLLESADKQVFIDPRDGREVFVRSGSDWDCDAIEAQLDPSEIKARNIPDFPHIELVFFGELRYEACKAAKARRIAERELYRTSGGNAGSKRPL